MDRPKQDPRPSLSHIAWSMQHAHPPLHTMCRHPPHTCPTPNFLSPPTHNCSYVYPHPSSADKHHLLRTQPVGTLVERFHMTLFYVCPSVLRFPFLLRTKLALVVSRAYRQRSNRSESSKRNEWFKQAADREVPKASVKLALHSAPLPPSLFLPHSRPLP